MSASGDETDVAIIGMAGRFPGAATTAELWRNLREGVESVRPLSDEELRAAGVAAADLTDPQLVKAIAMPEGIDRFDAGFFGYSHREAELLDPQQRLLLECAWEALEDAGYGGEAHPGPTGVFAGASTSTYLLYHLLANPAVAAAADPLQIDLANSGDYVTTRISHKLNLTGPSYHLQSACSTALVAVHAACQSLLSDECDLALAGGASINVGQLRGYRYQRGGIVSPDGHCRAFDAAAQGSVVGSGVAIVVLKRLADALADRDTIRAVIRGSAVNNDGAQKVGYTAPSVEGQARVIAEALARSGVHAAEISYVETHGTGTALGDPIEIAALTRAFRVAGRRRSCALGSIKTNLGHLATAAGIAGLVKTVLALEHRMIPPSLHFQRPNPEIDFAAGPFYVNPELAPWPAGGQPRRAGVSAFGFGGTNAHVVLEEAPAAVPATASTRQHQLLLLAARSPAALAAATANLAAHLRARPDLDLADVAYTLQRGRRAFVHRRAVVCRDPGEAARLLAEPAAEGVFTACHEGGARRVAFLFPGLGDQHLQMARGLYEAEPAFRAEVDRGCQLLAEPLEVDLREVLYPPRQPVPAPAPAAGQAPGPDLRQLLGRGPGPAAVDEAGPAGEAARRLDRVRFSQPAVFLVEYALARLWMDWGVQPSAMIGYSLGEYTAACIAGVLGFEDALRLVAERARLVDELPAGAMLAVPLAESDLLPLLGPDLCLAAVNAPQMSVAAGTAGAVAELERELERRGVASRRLRVSHAFHSRLMEPLAEQLAELAGRFELRPPRIPYLSNVTGTWITAGEATDPRYWARHLCQPVRLAAGLGELLQDRGRLLLEVGPGQTLSVFARQHPASAGVVAVPCLSERGGSEDQAALLRAVGRLWLAGIEVDGARFFRHERRRRVALPTYPFERRRYWIEAGPPAALSPHAAPARSSLDLPIGSAVRLPGDPAAAPAMAPAADGPPAAAPLPGRGTLPAHPRPALANAYVAPRDETERLVAGIWQTLLGVEEIGVHDDFLELGGHSLLATRLIAHIRQLFGCELSMRGLFDRPTVAGFAAAIAGERRRRQEDAPAGAAGIATPAAPSPARRPSAVQDEPPLSFAQQRLWFLDQLEPGSSAYNLASAVRLRGALDVAALVASLAVVVRRHEALRTTFAVRGELPVQLIAPAGPVALPLVDLAAVAGAAHLQAGGAPLRGAELERLVHAAARRPFALDGSGGPLLRVQLLRLGEREHVVLVAMHHAVSDGWSMGVFVQEMTALYAAARRGPRPAGPPAAPPLPLPAGELDRVLPALPLQYADYAVWQREWLQGEVLASQLEFWRRHLAGAPPALEMPTDRPRPPRQTYRGGQEILALPAALREGAEALSRRLGVTPFMVLWSLFAALLSRYSGQDDLVVGTAIANRRWAELEGLIGLLANTLALRSDLAADPSLEQASLAAREALLGVYAHQDVPFEMVVEALRPERQLSRSPLFQAMVILENAPAGELVLPGLHLAWLAVDEGRAQFDLTLVLLPEPAAAAPTAAGPAVAPGGGWQARLEYNLDLFAAATARRLLERYQNLLAAAIAAPRAPLSGLDLLSAAERQELLSARNATRAAVPEASLPDLFAAAARRWPERVAVACAGEALSYGALAAASDRLARRLRGLGIGPEIPVAVAVERGPRLPVALLAVLTAGGAYLPLDPGHPRARLASMVAAARAPVLLCDSGVAAGLPAVPGTAVVALDRLDLTAGAGEAPTAWADGENPAYVIFTSGSTGLPKGVVVRRRGLVNFLAAMARQPGFSAADVMLAVTTVAFDIAALELFLPLLTGARIELATREAAADGARLAALAAASGATVLQATPATFRLLLDAGWEGQPALRALCGGEALPAELAASLLPRVGELWNLYGPTETTVWSAALQVAQPHGARARQEGGAAAAAAAPRPVPIGRPLANTEIYLLDRFGRGLGPVLPGAVGEIHIGGEGLARGYLGLPGLTAERFVPDPFAGRAGARLYRTGDLGRFRLDGELDFLGRGDSQVKVRGFRIELGEIEAVLGALPEVAACAVVVRAGLPADGGSRLVAYVVPPAPAPGAPAVEAPDRAAAVADGAPGPSAALLRAALRERLPDFMVPQLFVVLPALPLTPNGKLDRRRLAAGPEAAGGRRLGPGASGSAERGRGPRTPVEEILAAIWTEALCLAVPVRPGSPREAGPVSVDADFFDLGGHSLLAAQVLSRLRAAFGVEVPLRRFFDQPTVAGLAEAVAEARDARRGASLPPLLPAPRDRPLPLSFAQQRLWLLDRLVPGSALYNIPLAVRIDGRLDAGTLRRSLTEIVRRHEALRTVFVEHDDGTLVQVVRPAGRAPLSEIDLRALGPEAAALLGAGSLAAAAARRPFDLARGPLWRALLLRLGGSDHLLVLNFHHGVCDGWSLGVLMEELPALYRAFAAGLASPLPELPVQYADFAAWQRQWLAGELLAAQLAFWQRRLAGAPPLLDLPSDRPRPAIQRPAGGVHPFLLPAELRQRLAALSRRSGVTLFMALLAAWKLLLARTSGQQDIVVGTPVAGRNHLLIERLIGVFVNTLAIRTDLSGDPSFTELLARLRESVLSAFAHQDLPFERLVGELQLGRDLSRTPLFQVVFAMQHARLPPAGLPELRFAPAPLPSGTAKFDLAADLADTGGGGLAGSLEYRRDLFERVTMQRLAGHFLEVLAGAAGDPGLPISRLPVLTAAEAAQAVREWNDTSRAFPPVPPVHEQFAAHARRRPDATAVASRRERLTYGELDRRANRLAHHLRRRGIGPEVLVAVCTGRTLDRVVGILGVLKAGGAYVSLDPDYPPERLGFLLEDSGAPVLLTEDRYAARLPRGRADLLRLDRDWTAVAGDEAVAPPGGAAPQHLAYVVYTSGSTGRPKGVEITHAGLLNLVCWYQECFALRPGDRGTQIASPAFDASVVELWPFLAGGGEVHIPDEETRLSAPGMLRWWAETGITLAYLMTPLAEGVLEELRREPAAAPALSVRSLFTGGDRLHHRPVPAAGFRLWNTYGPAEYTVTTSAVAVEPAAADGALPSIGRPLPNTSIYVLDARQQPVPPGVPGELYVAGVGLARGYLGRPELTAEKFVPDSWGTEPGARMYRTADLVRRLPDGDLEFLGRIDHQVKLLGHRIELGEIEAALGRHPAVREAAVMVREDRPGARRLVAWVVPAAQPGPAPAELRGFLKRWLPDVMVPAAWVEIAALPLNANGKLDRAALPAPRESGSAEDGYVPPRGPLEEILAGIWEEVLARAPVGVTEDFFALGGHSLLATQVMTRVRRTLGVELPLRVLFESPTIAALAAAIDRSRRLGGLAAVPAPPLVRVPRQQELSLSFAQEWLWFVEQLERAGSLSVTPVALRLLGELRVEALAASLREVVRRHEVLRTRFVAIGGRPVQRVDDGWRPGVPVLDLAGLPAAAAAQAVERAAAAEETRGFDLVRGPLLRCTLVRQAADDFVLLLTLHHIVCDGWSMGVLVREMLALYSACLRGEPSPLPELPVQYADFAAWQRQWLRGEVLDRHLRHATQRLAGLAPLALPTDRPATAPGQVSRAGNLPVALAEPLIAALRLLARRQGATLFMALLAGFAALLRRHTGQDEFAIGSPVANRTRVDLEALIGFFINTLVLRAETGGNPGFAELVARVRATTLEAYDHQDLPFTRLVEALRPDRRQAPSALLEVLFLLQNQPLPAIELPGVKLGELRRGPADIRTHFALSLDLIEAGGGLAGGMAYNRQLFDGTTAARWLGHLGTLLAAVAERPELRLDELPLLAEGERHQVLVEWGEDGDLVLLGSCPAPIGIWGEGWRSGPGGVCERREKRCRRRADGSLEILAPAAAAPVQAAEPASPAAGGRQEVAERLGDQARRREKLSAAKRDLLARRFRGDAKAAAAGARMRPRQGPSSLLVKLQAGASGRPPLFCVHPVGGTVHSYGDLARCLGPEQPFYALQAAGLAGSGAVGDLRTMAAEYAAAVEGAAPEGPTLLGGWSFGGVVAFEMACQLQTRGREVAMLTLLDSMVPAPDAPLEDLDEAGLLRLFLREQAGLAPAGGATWLDERPPAAEQAAEVSWLLARAHATGLLKTELRPEQVQRLLDVNRANRRALAGYRPRPYAGRITVFRSTSAAAEPAGIWEALSGQPVEAYEVAADHYGMLKPPAVAALAQRLGSCIERALGAAAPTAPGEIEIARPRPSGGRAAL